MKTIFFFFNDTATTEIYTLSLHDALPIFAGLKSNTTSPPTGGSSTQRSIAGTCAPAMPAMPMATPAAASSSPPLPPIAMLTLACRSSQEARVRQLEGFVGDAGRRGVQLGAFPLGRVHVAQG